MCVIREVEVEVSGKKFKLNSQVVSIKRQQRTIHGKEAWLRGCGCHAIGSNNDVGMIGVSEEAWL